MIPALLALGLGAAGGLAFREAGLPLPWMLGAMAANLASCLAGARPKVPQPVRAVMIGVLGLMLGSAFSPAMLEQAGRWPAGMAAVLAYVVLGTAILALLFRRLAGYDPVTAYFSAAPGGLSEMILTGTAMGGDERTISLTHALRILLVVFTVPFAFRLFGGYQGGGGGLAASLGSLAELDAADALVLAGCAVAGGLAARAVRMPAANLTGPMLASAALHLSGLTESHPPAELVAAAQVVVGASIGARFAIIRKDGIGREVLAATAATALLLALTMAIAWAAATFSDLPFAVLILALAPGGLTEMCLIAVALQADVAFVSAHHFARIVMVVMLAPLAFRLLRRQSGRH